MLPELQYAIGVTLMLVSLPPFAHGLVESRLSIVGVSFLLSGAALAVLGYQNLPPNLSLMDTPSIFLTAIAHILR